jgi:hypothetical protein
MNVSIQNFVHKRKMILFLFMSNYEESSSHNLLFITPPWKLVTSIFKNISQTFMPLHNFKLPFKCKVHNVLYIVMDEVTNFTSHMCHEPSKNTRR